MSELVLTEYVMSVAADRRRVSEFLARFGLKYEPLDYYAAFCDGDEMLCGGGCEANTIKCVAVDESLRGEGYSAKLVSHITARLRAQGAQTIFVFTKPENEDIFKGLAFFPVGATDEAILLESRRDGAASFARSLEPFKGEGVQGAIVMNANPFTNGHLSLIQRAKAMCSTLHVLIVREERSAFTFAVRKRLVEAGTAHIPGVIVHDGGPYVISGATFPSYFLKEDSDRTSVYARLDISIFGRWIAPALGISRRFAGEEPLDPATNRYNDAMLQLLPGYGVEPIIMKREEHGGEVISASRLRKLAAKVDWDALAPLCPPTTLEFLRSDEGAAILERLSL